MKRMFLVIIAFSIVYTAVLIFNAARKENRRRESKEEEEAKSKLVLWLIYLEAGLMVLYSIVYFINI